MSLNQLQTVIQTYLNKFSHTTKLIDLAIHDFKQTIVIPAYCEEELEKTLESLCDCAPVEYSTLILIILNSSEGDSAAKLFHEKQVQELGKKFNNNGKLIFRFILDYELPIKTAGVGLARKIGMDEAVRIFAQVNYNGLIVCLDADCTVSQNYLTELEKLAVDPLSYNSICVHFEHDYSVLADEILKQGIINYELFLRYYKESLQFAGFPYPYHTIGSSMAVKTSIYCMAGGMNKRKAGEDFYFLHKVFHYGKVIELNSVTVFPSARISHRVPFGTGRAQQNYVEEANNAYDTYNFNSFEDLKELFQSGINEQTSILVSPAMNHFLETNSFFGKVAEIRNNTSSMEQFRKRFFNWFDGFMVLKFVHFTRNNYYVGEPIEVCLGKLFSKIGIQPGHTKESTLESLRILQKKQKHFVNLQ